MRQLAGGSRAASFEAREAIAHQGAEATHFGDVLVRVNPSFALAMHTDTDEANAANVGDGMQGYIEGIQSEG